MPILPNTHLTAPPPVSAPLPPRPIARGTDVSPDHIRPTAARDQPWDAHGTAPAGSNKVTQHGKDSDRTGVTRTALSTAPTDLNLIPSLNRKGGDQGKKGGGLLGRDGK